MLDNRPERWEPSDPYLTGTRLAATMSRVSVRSVSAFCDLSVADPERFWAATLDDLGYEWLTPYAKLRDEPAHPSRTRWFIGGLTNVAHNAISRWAASARAGQPAIVEVTEAGTSKIVTYRELDRYAAAVARGLTGLGVGPGDRVAIVLPFTTEAAASLLAVAALGAVAVPLFSGYGADAMAQRLHDANPRVAIVGESITRRGRAIPLRATLSPALDAIPNLQVVLVSDGERLGSPPSTRDIPWQALAGTERGEALPVVAVDPNEPVLIAYSSGTTGQPKGIVHSHAGLPLKAAQEMAQVMDIGPGSRVLRVTDMGWVGGSYTILSGLTTGATLVMYSGAPTWPDAGRLWEVVAEHGVTHLGISPTLARMMQAAAAVPTADQITSLRMTTSVGEAWDASSYSWYARSVGANQLPIVNHSGGTEVGNLLCAMPALPISFGRFNSTVPGVDVAVYDESGVSITDEAGELVVRQPFVGLTRGLHGDDGRRFESTYWARFPGAWWQGDRAAAHADGTWELQGRSDDRMKVAGHSISPDDIEGAAVAVPGVSSAAAIAVPDPIAGSRVVLFVVPAIDADTSGLLERVRTATAESLGKALAPSEFYFAAGLPRTPGGKLMRRAVRHAFLHPEAGAAGETGIDGEQLDVEGARALASIAAAQSRPE
jgi:acetyl-CoA synthetase